MLRRLLQRLRRWLEVPNAWCERCGESYPDTLDACFDHIIFCRPRPFLAKAIEETDRFLAGHPD